MNKFRFPVFILIIFLVINPEYLCAINIYLNKFAYTYGNSIKVNDLALIQGGSESERNTISNLTLDTRIEKLSLIPARLIKQAIEPYYKGSVIIIGSRTAVVPLNTYPEEYISFYTELLKFIDSLDPVKNGRMEIEVLSSFSIPETSTFITPLFSLAVSSRVRSYLSGEITVSYSFADSNLSFIEKEILPVFQSNHNIEKELSNIYSIQNSSSLSGNIRIRINQFVPVSVLSSSVIKGEQVTGDKIVYHEMEISGIKDNFLDSAQESLDQFTYTKNLTTGSVITCSDVEKTELVKNGDTVKIIFSNKSIRITASGEAYSSGSFGDIIRVKPEHSTEIFDCTISGLKEVRIDIP
jgi:flagella basal body P-ring formation protein FlgA